MSENLIIGFITMTFCLGIQCVVVGILFDILLVLEKKQMIKTTLFGMSSLLVAVMLTMLAGNLLQITLWGGIFFACGEFKAAVVYSSTPEF